MNAQAIGATENTLQTAVANLDTLQALKRLIMLLESQACVDSGGRQRITADAFGAAATLPAVTAVGTVNTVTGVTTVATVSAVSSVTNVAAIANVDHHQFIDIAHTAYGNCVRSKLAFS